ncbi:MAG: hypothetical protein LBN02_07145 [Oscillospiraceae bacterium]|jgi:hypothetical protein|nr:hypothetical protein [Oscillospiraceae bacterium]
MSKSQVKFGTHEKFPLIRAPFARRGSVYYVYEDFYKHGQLKFGMAKHAEMISGTDFLFDIEFLANGIPVPYEYYADEGSIKLTHGYRWVEIAITDRQHLRVRGYEAGVRFTLNSSNGNGARALRGTRSLKDVGWETEFGKYGKLNFVPIVGSLHIESPYSYEKGVYERAEFEFIADAKTRTFDGAIHEYDGDELYPFGEYEPFDKLVADNKADFAEFKAKYRKVAKGYEQAADYAIYTVWSYRINPRGYIKSPAIMFSLQWAIVAASWQQSYNAMPMQRDLKEAWRQICLMFDYQDERTGRVDGMLAFTGAAASMQPPFQGFALEFILRNVGDDFISAEEAAKMYPKFARWVNYWTTYRNAGRGDDVTAIFSPHESGWDDASNFQDGFPANDPNNLTFLVLLMECVALLAKKAGDIAVSDEWYARANKLTQTIIDEFWDGEKFATMVKGKRVDSMSLADFQPIILGKRLPQHIIDKVAERVLAPGEWLTEIGLASESMKSPLVTFGISFVCGRVVAPQNMIIAVGLQAAGKQKEAEIIARLFCDNVKEKGMILGFAPYDHFPLTGEPAPDQPMPFATDGWPWTTWCANGFLTLASSVIDA